MTNEHKTLQKKYDFLKSQMESFIRNTNEMAKDNEQQAEKEEGLAMKKWLEGRNKAYLNCADSVKERLEVVEEYYK